MTGCVIPNSLHLQKNRSFVKKNKNWKTYHKFYNPHYLLGGHHQCMVSYVLPMTLSGPLRVS